MANMTINSPQITVCWYIDDPKVSHKEETSLDAFSLKICYIFGNDNKFIRVKVQKYLKMDMYWYHDITMIISMIK